MDGRGRSGWLRVLAVLAVLAHGGTITAQSLPDGRATMRGQLPLGGPTVSPAAPRNGSATPP